MQILEKFFNYNQKNLRTKRLTYQAKRLTHLTYQFCPIEYFWAMLKLPGPKRQFFLLQRSTPFSKLLKPIATEILFMIVYDASVLILMNLIVLVHNRMFSFLFYVICPTVHLIFYSIFFQPS
jgi:hypothetical protein